MAEITVTLIVGLVGTFSLVAKKADSFNISAPMVFITMGVFMGLILRAIDESVVGDGTPHELVLIIAELTLVIVLFHDASTIHLKTLFISIPLRLLTVGLALTLLALFGVVRALLPNIGAFGALLVAASLTPTDAGLGAPTILNENVPSRIRQALNVESGINDGMITPIVFISLAGLVSSEGSGAESIPEVALAPIAIAVALAAFITPVFSYALDYTAKEKISTHAG